MILREGIRTQAFTITRVAPFLCPLLMPLFSTSGDVFSGFQTQSGQPYSCLAEARVTGSLTLTSDLLVVSMATKLFSSTYLQEALVGLQTETYRATAHSVRPGRQMFYRLSYAGSATLTAMSENFGYNQYNLTTNNFFRIIFTRCKRHPM